MFYFCFGGREKFMLKMDNKLEERKLTILQ